ncbi:MAG: hypothetical protein HXX09_08420 [Bacteroidetes bacterium]|nr:hypothetical protein [Bacteroidota bacterium]
MKKLLYLTFLIVLFYSCEKDGYHKVEITTYSETGGGWCYLLYSDANGYESKSNESGNHKEKMTFSEEDMTSGSILRSTVSFVNEYKNISDSLYIKVSHKGKEVICSKRFINTDYPQVRVSLASLVH